MSTKRTIAEAEAYIIESIEFWKSKGKEKSIISLSNWAECWRVRGESTETAYKIKKLESGINSLQHIIDSNKKLGMKTEVLQDQWQIMFDSLYELKMTFEPRPKRLRKSNK